MLAPSHVQKKKKEKKKEKRPTGEEKTKRGQPPAAGRENRRDRPIDEQRRPPSHGTVPCPTLFFAPVQKKTIGTV